MVQVNVVECPECGAPLQPRQNRCDYCRSFIVISAEANRHFAHQLVDEFERAVAGRNRDGAMTALRDAASLDPEGIRPRLVRFVTTHHHLIACERFPQRPLASSIVRPRWFMKSLGIALVTALALLIIAMIFAVQTPEKDGTADISDPRGIASLIALLAMPVAGVVILLRGKQRADRQAAGDPRSRRYTVDELIANGQIPIDHLSEAAQVIVDREARGRP